MGELLIKFYFESSEFFPNKKVTILGITFNTQKKFKITKREYWVIRYYRTTQHTLLVKNYFNTRMQNLLKLI